MPNPLTDRLNIIVKNINKQENLEKIAKFIVDIIRKRTLLGYGVDDMGDEKHKLKPLSPNYINFRKKNKPTGPTTPSKSNLTYTGDMLKALDFRLNGTTITIGIFDLAEADKAFWNMLQGREFLNLSGAEIQQVKNFIKKLVDEEISKQFKN